LDGHGGDVDGNAAERKAYRGKEGSSSFLKKRTKKLLSVWFTRVFRRIRTSSSKSFLVLFFKKGNCPGRRFQEVIDGSRVGVSQGVDDTARGHSWPP
jgi:hypothetical protein